MTPLSYIGWGKTTQLGYGLGLAMGAKVARPDQLCINWWGEAAIGMTGMDFETCVRCQIPIMSILSNNFGMKTEYAAMKVSHEKYRTCDISGHYADFARAMGGYGERVTEPEQSRPCDRQRHPSDQGRQARAARIHHHARGAVLDRGRARLHALGGS